MGDPRKKSGIRVMITEYSEKHTGFRKFARFGMKHARSLRYKTDGFRTSPGEKTVFFKSFKGASYTCSPKAIYEYMRDTPGFEEYTFIWAFYDPDEYLFLLEDERTHLVHSYGKQFEQALHRSKYWIVNYRLEYHIVPSKDQVYVQCWHGTPLKKLGYDLKNSDNAMNSSEEIWDKYRVDAARFRYLISPSPFATERFSSAWNLSEWGRKDAIIEEGYPRNDFLINCGPEEAGRIRREIGIPDEDRRRILLYAPTWRDNQYNAATGYVYDLALDPERLRRELSDDFIILMRLHYLVSNSLDLTGYEGFIYDLSDYDDINHLYIVSDALITDYSSVFFDYANLRKPIIFYMYDIEEYRDEIRGFYVSPDELPGEIVTDEDGLIRAVKELPADFVPDEKYTAFNRRFDPLDDGHVCERVVKRIFGGGNGIS